MSVWLAIPSKRPPEEAEKVLKLWRERGYKIALYVDTVEDAQAVDHLCDAGSWPERVGTFGGPAPYPGYAMAVNFLVKIVLAKDPQAEWIVTGGDDIEPDPNHSAEEIALQCTHHFLGDTFGVMQCTGDRWGENAVPGLQGAYVDRVCGSPWMGREFCRRMYQGNGPLFSGYRHMFEDEELQNVAQKLGVLWQRPNLTHHHRHWGRVRHGGLAKMPDFLRSVNTPEHWAQSKALFDTRKAGGFPGHEPIA